MPQVSVIIPTHNYGRFLREAIESVQAQAVRDLEIIVVDDGSTDETPDVLASIRDPRLRVFRIPQGGVSVARNEGLSRARGRFIAYLDADDRWRPTYLERQLEVLESEPGLGAVFTNFARFNEKGLLPRDQFSFFPELKSLPSEPTRRGGGRRITAEPFCGLISWSEFPTWLQTIVFRAESVAGTRFSPEISKCEDLHFCFRVFRRIQVGYIDEPLVEVRRHGSNMTSRIGEMPHAKLHAFSLLEREALHTHEMRALRRRMGRQWVNIGRTYAAEGRYREAYAALRQGSRYSGWSASVLYRTATALIGSVLR